jgi:hypothetical protein
MATITTRSGKGSPLTNTEVDNNFTNLNTAKYESGASPTFVTTTTRTVQYTDTENEVGFRLTTDGAGSNGGRAYILLDSDSTDGVGVGGDYTYLSSYGNTLRGESVFKGKIIPLGESAENTTGRIQFGTDVTGITLRREADYELILEQNASSNNLLRLNSAGSVTVGIDVNDNDTNKEFAVYKNASGTSGEKLFHVHEDGTVQAHIGQIKAGSFGDNQDSAYYLNPSAQTKINTLNVRNSEVFPRLLYVDHGGTSETRWYKIAEIASNNGHAHFYGIVGGHVGYDFNMSVDITVTHRGADWYVTGRISGANDTSQTSRFPDLILTKSSTSSSEPIEVWVETRTYGLVTLDGSFTQGASLTYNASYVVTEPSAVTNDELWRASNYARESADSFMLGNLYAGSSVRAPVLYDSADSSCFLDLNGALSMRTAGHIDIKDTTTGAFRIYNGSTFRGGIGTARWAGEGAGTESDITIYSPRDACIHVNDRTQASVRVSQEGHLCLEKGYQIGRTTAVVTGKPKVVFPNVHWGEGGSSTGAVIIYLPGDLDDFDMCNIELSVYEYNSNAGSKIFIAGHNWGNGTSQSAWYNYNVQVVGPFNKSIRLAAIGTRRVIVIGDTTSSWSYGKVTVDRVSGTGNYSSNMDWSSDWAMELSTSYTALWTTGDLNTPQVTFRTSGYMSTPKGTYAPIYYDYNDSGWYADPSAYSKLNEVGVNKIRSAASQSIMIYAGETYSVAPAFNDEYIHLGAEQGVKIYSSNNNWNTYSSADWSARNEVVLCTSSNGLSYMKEVVLRTPNAGVDSDAECFRIDGVYTDGRYTHRFRKQDLGGGVPLFLDTAGSTADAYSYLVRFGSYTGNGYEMELWGDFKASGTINASSDERLKDNVEVIPNAVEKVKAIRGVSFTRNDLEDTERRHVGVIAQEVEKVLPEVVTEDEKGMKSVAYANMVGLLIEAIKEQQEQIDTLKAALEAK